jgi:hypothetical protein
MATIKIKRSSTAASVGPENEGEISANLADKKIFVGLGTGVGVATFVDEGQVDTKITNSLTSAFTYKGTVNGNDQLSGATITAPTSLAQVVKTGDYYKVATKGFLNAHGAPDNTSAFYVNPNDGVVYNGSSWDIIDNTNSTVASSGASITVTGSSDLGYDVAVSTVDGGAY